MTREKCRNILLFLLVFVVLSVSSNNAAADDDKETKSSNSSLSSSSLLEVAAAAAAEAAAIEEELNRNTTSSIIDLNAYGAQSTESFYVTYKIRRSSRFNVTCPSDGLRAGYKFDRLLFNSSVYDVENINDPTDLTLSKDEFEYVFDDLIQTNNADQKQNKLFSNDLIDFRKSGRYYCIYSRQYRNAQQSKRRYLIRSFLFIVYDDIKLATNFNDVIQLKPCLGTLTTDLEHIKWFTNEPGIIEHDSKYFKLNKDDNSLSIRMNEKGLYDLIYRSQNIQNGAFCSFSIDCSDCEANTPDIPPIVSPSKMLVTKGSDSTLNCEYASSAREPDSIYWFKNSNENDGGGGSEMVNTDLKRVVGVGHLLELKNINESNLGWYSCCLLYSSAKPEERRVELNKAGSASSSASSSAASAAADYSDGRRPQNEIPMKFVCSQVELEFSSDESKVTLLSKIIFAIIVIIISGVILLIWSFICYILYRKLRTYNDAQKASKAMRHNDIYQTDFMEIDEGLPRRHQLNKLKSDSIECLLENEEIKKWRIPIKEIAFGNVIGQGAFGVVMHAKLNSTSSSSSSYAASTYLSAAETSSTSSSTTTPSSPTIISNYNNKLLVPNEAASKKRRDTDSGMGSETSRTLAQLLHNSNASSAGVDEEKQNLISSGENIYYNNLQQQPIKKHDDNEKQTTTTTTTSVAIKKLKENAKSENFHELFKELLLMFQLGSHPYIINLIGFSLEDDSLFIITEYAKFGNLKDFLRQQNEVANDGLAETEESIDNERLLLYSYQIAKGMQFLHSKKVLHRDLAARNILVDNYDTVKIADFGLARSIRSDYYQVQQVDGKFPLKWMSPEALTYNRISKKSDIWSYGVLLWEIWSHGCSPYPSIQVEDILKKLTSGYRMEKPEQLSSSDDCFIYEKIMTACWQFESKKRPTFKQIVDLFRAHASETSPTSSFPSKIKLVELIKRDDENKLINSSNSVQKLNDDQDQDLELNQHPHRQSKNKTNSSISSKLSNKTNASNDGHMNMNLNLNLNLNRNNSSNSNSSIIGLKNHHHQHNYNNNNNNNRINSDTSSVDNNLELSETSLLN